MPGLGRKDEANDAFVAVGIEKHRQYALQLVSEWSGLEGGRFAATRGQRRHK